MYKAPQPEKTFRDFSVDEAKTYASQRAAYGPAVYEVVLAHHAATGGSFDLLLDCGCGPGNATRELASSFEDVLGLDAGAGMIKHARQLGGKTKSGREIRYEVSGAEDLKGVEGLGEGTVDVLTVATAAHWFDMSLFWAEAARVLKPGGTVAMWIRGNPLPHPSVPNAQKIKDAIDHFGDVVLAPYKTQGNLLAENLYDDLPLPWDVSPPVTAFPKSEYVRHQYDRDGVLSNGETFFTGGIQAPLALLKKLSETMSPVKRWAAANPELVGTDKDVVNVLVDELKELAEGQKTILCGSAVVILLFKKAR